MSLCDSKLPITESNGIVQKACHHADEKQSSNWRRHSPTSPTTSSATPEPRRLLYCRACRTEQDLHHTSDAESANSLTQIQLLQQETISTHVEALRLGQVDVLLDTTASEHVDDPATPAAPPPPSTLPDALFEVRSSPLGGSGVFALQDLAFGQQILSETALLYADKINLYEEVDKLDPASRKLFDDLHAFKRTSSTDAIAARFWTNWSPWYTSSFKTAHGSGIFPLSARFNHACRGTNNVDFTLPSFGTVPFADTKVVTTHLVMRICSPHGVKAGEELTIAYGPPPDVLLLNWGFQCRCGGCESGGLSDEQVEDLLSNDPWAFYRSKNNSSRSIKVDNSGSDGGGDGSDSAIGKDYYAALTWLGNSKGEGNSLVWRVPKSCGKPSAQW
ncbi:SET domain-containing protein-lysine N-methyltransferase [Microdochium nivale]|nr:SET domain-containing protein-lysine N-methyltransferase [Microdochium nivale]